MVEVKLGSTEIELYQHSDEMPIELYNLSNEYAMRDAQIGSSMQDVLNHHEKFHFFVAQGDFDSAVQVSKNMYQTYFNILNRNNFKGLSFACHIKKINNAEVKEYGFSDLKKILDDLSAKGLTHKMVVDTNGQLKKKFWLNLGLLFLKSLVTRMRSKRSRSSGTASSQNSTTL